MVWFVDRIEDYLWEFVDYLYDLYLESRDIPFVGGIISGIVYSAYYAMWYVAYYLGDFNTWCDRVEDTVDYFSDWIDWLYDAISGVYTVITGFLSWTEIKDKIEDTYAILSMTYKEIVGLGKGAILGTYTSLSAWFNAQEEKVVGWVEARFEDILDEVFK